LFNRKRSFDHNSAFMKKTTLFPSMAVIVIFTSIACKKEINSVDDLNSIDLSSLYTGNGAGNRDLSFKVVEFGSGNKIADSKLNFILPTYIPDSVGPVQNTWYTDSSGEIRLMHGQFPPRFAYTSYYYEVEKNGYWNNGGVTLENNTPVDGFEADSVISTVNKDSLVVSLFPISWLKIHLKAVNTYDTSVSLVLYDHILKYPGYVGKYYNNIENGLILPHAGQIDTTFTIMTKGNVNNELMIALYGANGVPITETRYVAKGETVNWELQF